MFGRIYFTAGFKKKKGEKMMKKTQRGAETSQTQTEREKQRRKTNTFNK